MIAVAFKRSGFHPPGSMNKYYVVSVAGILFFLYAIFRFDYELKVKISLLTVSCTLSIYMVEIFLSYSKNLRPEHIRANLAEKAGKPYDTRHRAQVWLDLRSNGIDAYPLYSPYDNMELKESDILPLGFISDKTVIFCNESGEFRIFKTDEHGFNNPEGLFSSENIDYVLIGDSFTQGSCVKREENIAGELTSSGFKVLNLGVINSGPPKELAILKEYAKPLKPKVVFWIFYEANDYEGLAFEKKSSVYMKYLDKDFSRNLINKQNLIDDTLIKHLEKEFSNLDKEWEKKVEEANKNIDKYSLNISLDSLKLPMLRKRIGSCNKENTFKSDPLLKEIFFEANRTVTEWGGQIVFVYLPSYFRYSEKIDKCKIRFLDMGRDEVLAVMKDLKIPVIDIKSSFDTDPDPLSFFPYRIYGHYNAAGYKLVAEQIETYLANNKPNNGGVE